MAGSTTELSLSTAVDSDDNADYLTINLANSLRTVDGLFNSVTGHTHAGAHQGAPIVPATGSITSAQIADGTIVAADIADATITNAKLGPDVARANLLTNGGFEIWQRGNGPLTTGYAADRWALGFGAGSSMSASRVASPNVATSSQYAMQVVYTHSAASTVNQKLDNAQLGGVTLTVSLMVRTATANAVRLRIDNTAGGLGTPGAYHPGDGTYRVLTVTQALPSTATDAFVAVEFNVSCTAYLDNACLVVGSQPANYAPLHPADDLARCLRYYQVLAGGVGGSGSFVMTGYGSAGQAVYLWVPALAQMTVNPTVTKNGTWSVVNCGQPTVYAGTLQGATITANATAAGQVFVQGAASAGLTLEANP
jgi:hypothetical protein